MKIKIIGLWIKGVWIENPKEVKKRESFSFQNSVSGQRKYQVKFRRISFSIIASKENAYLRGMFTKNEIQGEI